MRGKAKKIAIVLLVLAAAFSTAGCIRVKRKVSGGGVYKSADGSETWQQKVFVSEGKKGKEVTIGHVDVETMAMDPQDPGAIYIGTREDGMHVTFDGGEHWKTALVSKGYVGNIAVDPKNSNTVYVAVGNKIVRSDDRGEKWTQVYLETVSGQTVTALAVDSYDSSKVYCGISDGRVLKSANRGSSWTVVHTSSRKDKVSQIIINPGNTQIVYAAYASSGIFRTTDGGQTWADIGAGLKKYGKASHFRTAAIAKNLPDSLVIATGYGLLATEDGGANWAPIKLLTSPGTMDIHSLAVNPQNASEIYYGTATAVYKTTDGGRNWLARSLPTDRAASALAINPFNPNIIYLGAKKVKK